MEITDVSVKLISDKGELKGFANIVIDDSIAIHDIRIIETNGNTYIAMPARETKSGVWIDIVYPINQKIKDSIQKEILTKYFYAKSSH